MNPRIVSGVVRTATSLLQNSAGATKALNSSVATAQSLVNTSGNVAKLSDEATAVKDKFINTRAKSNIEKMLGVENSVANAEEKLRKELIDSKFTVASELFKRVQNIFLPTEFPSGTKINLRKSCVNEIANNAAKGKNTSFEYVDKTGATIKGFVSNKVKKQGEDCFLAQIQRITSDKISEVVEVRYYPKSFEIKTVSRAANGNKSATTVYGNENGGKILSIKPSSDAHTKAIGQKLNIVSK